MGRPVNPNVPEDGYKSKRQFEQTGTIAESDFAVADDITSTKKIVFNTDNAAIATTTTIKAGANSGNITITLPATSGTLITSATDNPAFGLIQPITGTTPTATVAVDTLTITSSDSSIAAVGNSSNNSLDLKTSANTKVSSFGVSIDGGGIAITTGVKGYVYVPYAGTISSWTVLGDVSGSIVIDVWKIAFASNTLPTVANTITAADLPTISSSKTGQNTNPSTWTGLAVSAGDVIGFNVNSCTTITKANLIIKVVRT